MQSSSQILQNVRPVFLNRCYQCNRKDCYECLQHLHNISTKNERYSCTKITYNYLLKQGHRFASEISKAITLIKPQLDLSKKNYVTSVGCGPCTELYGCINALPGASISYLGFDRNPIWNELQQFNKKNLENDKIRIQYSTEDFIDHARQERFWADILVLNYFFSDFMKYDETNCEYFIEQLVSLINEGKFRFIVINDIMLLYLKKNNVKTVYYCMETLVRKLKSTKEVLIKGGRVHYQKPNQYQFSYGQKRDSSLCFPIIEESVKPFEPFDDCGSIQLIIQTKKISQ